MKAVTVTNDNVSQAVRYSLKYETLHNGNHCQFKLTDKSKSTQFVQYLNTLSQHTFIDALGGDKAPSSMRRYRVTDLSFDEAVQGIKISSCVMGAGIKTVYTPFIKSSPWETWDGGYIEGYIRYCWGETMIITTFSFGNTLKRSI